MRNLNFIVVLVGIFAAGALFTPVGSKEPFDLMNVVGEWEGEGKFLMPVTEVEIEIEGEGKFEYLPELDVIRTEMSGTKFLLSYTDSGYLRHYPETDSVSWEIWDSWGKHSVYWGEIQGEQLVATRDHPKRQYKVTVEFPHPDTLDFRLITTDTKSLQRQERARFLLWRVK